MGSSQSSTTSSSPATTAKLGTKQSLRRKLEDEYFVQKVTLGTGSFGVVRRAVHRVTSADRAVKSIDKRRLDAKPNLRQHLQREIDIMRECTNHENIVKLYDWFEDELFIHLVLEYCDGGDFGDKLNQLGNSISEKQACEWMYQILLAVDHLHAKSVCHRDVKPENFLISNAGGSIGSGGILKLSDFGLAIRVADAKRSTLRELAGTPAFQAPEIHNLNVSGGQTSAGYGLPVDLWACGCTLFVILSGGRKNAFVSAENKLQLSDIRSGTIRYDELMPTTSVQPTELPGLSIARIFSKTDIIPSGNATPRRTVPNSNAEHLLRLLLTVDPSRRISAAEALRHPWFVQHGLVAPPPASPKMAASLGTLRPTNSGDASEDLSLEASPPTMQPVLEEDVRSSGLVGSPCSAFSDHRNLAAGSGGSLRDRGSSSDLFELHIENAMTIGPRGEGKVLRCEKCGSFYYCRRSDAKSAALCQECRVVQGYALPVDSLSIGALGYYPIGDRTKKWVGGKITKFIESTGEFLLEDGSCVSGASLAPPSKETGPGNPWPNGTNVMYMSSTYGTWLPAYIESFNQSSKSYDLDVKTNVPGDKIRLRIKRVAAGNDK